MRAPSAFLQEKLIKKRWWTWARSSTPRSTSTTPTSTGTSSSRPRSPSSSPRTASSRRTSGVRSVCSRAVGGCTTRSTGRNRTSCCSAARSTTSSNRKRQPPPRRRCCPSDRPGEGGGDLRPFSAYLLWFVGWSLMMLPMFALCSWKCLQGTDNVLVCVIVGTLDC